MINNWIFFLVKKMGFTEFQRFFYYWVLPSFIGFYWVLLGFTRFYWVLLGFTGFYWVLLGFTGFHWVLSWNTDTALLTC